MRVVVITGSSKCSDRPLLERLLAGAELLIVGDAKGVDQDALCIALDWDIIPVVYCASPERYAIMRQYEQVQSFLAASWKRQRKKAGPIRNAAMVRRAHEERMAGMDVRCYALPGPKSVGTHDCAKQLRDAGFCVEEYPVAPQKLAQAR